jgi:hypothetical protein
MSHNLDLYHNTRRQFVKWYPDARITRVRNLALLVTGLCLGMAIHLSQIAGEWPLPGKEPSLVNRLDCSFLLYADCSRSRWITIQRARRGRRSALSVLMARSGNPPRAYCDLLSLHLSLLPFRTVHVIISRLFYSLKYNSHHRCGTGNQRDETNQKGPICLGQEGQA